MTSKPRTTGSRGQCAYRALERRCRETLLRQAGRHWHGSRRELRLAVGRFLRRQRGDRRRLQSLLCRAAASSAFAMAVLGIAASSAEALGPRYREYTGAGVNPLHGVDLGDDTRPAFGDLDGDGDPDILVASRSGTVQYFENLGPPESPVFVQRLGAQNPMDGVFIGAPAIADLDGDGDLDVIAGESAGGFRYFENTGTPGSPSFVERTGGQNPLDGEDIGNRSVPALMDLDVDGDLDLIAGNNVGGFHYFENVGSSVSPVFMEAVGAQNPMDGEDIGVDAAPRAADLDGDGDFDLVVGSAASSLHYFENTGSPVFPQFLERAGDDSPFAAGSLIQRSVPAFADLDADGDLDILSGSYEGELRFVSHRDFIPVPEPETIFGTASPDGRAKLAFADLDGDGDSDLLFGVAGGELFLSENLGSPTTPSFDTPDSFGGLTTSSAPSFVDLDGDGDPDLIVGAFAGDFAYGENVGGGSFLERTGSANPLDGVDVGAAAVPAFADLDGDGDYDLVSGEYYGSVLYFENTGTPTNASFTQRIGAANPFDGVAVNLESSPAFTDLELDGDIDLVVGDLSGGLSYFENVGSPTVPLFVAGTGEDNPLDGESPGPAAAPRFVDFDGDGDFDLVAGNYQGDFSASRYCPEPGSSSMLAGGAGLLGWLRRWRKRSGAR